MSRVYAANCQALSGYACILSQVMSSSLYEVVLSEGPEMMSEVIDMASVTWCRFGAERRAICSTAECSLSAFHTGGYDRVSEKELKGMGMQGRSRL